MLIERLDGRGLLALEAAVRAGEPVRLGPRALDALPAGVAADEVAPLCHAVDEPGAARFLPPPARPRPELAVSVVVPTHRRRPIGLDALDAQDVATETIVLANGEYTDGVRVPWRGHGATRNLGVRLARHPYVLLTVDDALPLGAGFVRTLVEALEAGGFDAVTARQVPWPTSDAVTRARLRAWTPPPEPDGEGKAGYRAAAGHPDKAGNSPGVLLDNVAALYRREALLADPFDEVDIAEDWLWGRRHRVGYVATAPVAHAHPRRFRELYARTRDIHRVRVSAGEAPTVPGFGALLAALPGTVGGDARGALGELLGQWVGGRTRR